MMMMMMPIAVDPPATILEGFDETINDVEVRGKIATVQTIALLRSTRILGSVRDLIF